MTPPFPRTVCACPGDVENCSRPGYLIPGDLIAIGELLRDQRGENPLQMFEASHGAVVADSSTGRRFRIATIVPKVRHGRCVFLDGHRRCTIHEAAPFACAFFDVHMGWVERQRRTAWGLRQVRDHEEYARIRDALANRDGGMKEPLAFAKASH